MSFRSIALSSSKEAELKCQPALKREVPIFLIAQDLRHQATTCSGASCATCPRQNVTTERSEVMTCLTARKNNQRCAHPQRMRAHLASTADDCQCARTSSAAANACANPNGVAASPSVGGASPSICGGDTSRRAVCVPSRAVPNRAVPSRARVRVHRPGHVRRRGRPSPRSRRPQPVAAAADQPWMEAPRRAAQEPRHRRRSPPARVHDAENPAGAWPSSFVWLQRAWQ
jgi:hypothetical protein